MDLDFKEIKEIGQGFFSKAILVEQDGEKLVHLVPSDKIANAVNRELRELWINQSLMYGAIAETIIRNDLNVNVVTPRVLGFITDYFEEPTRLVMEFMDGENLHDKKDLSPPIIEKVSTDIAEMLSIVHDYELDESFPQNPFLDFVDGIVKRDLEKSGLDDIHKAAKRVAEENNNSDMVLTLGDCRKGNIMIGKNDETIAIDFGNGGRAKRHYDFFSMFTVIPDEENDTIVKKIIDKYNMVNGELINFDTLAPFAKLERLAMNLCCSNEDVQPHLPKQVEEVRRGLKKIGLDKEATNLPYIVYEFKPELQI